jgi:hypothetical protein
VPSIGCTEHRALGHLNALPNRSSFTRKCASTVSNWCRTKAPFYSAWAHEGTFASALRRRMGRQRGERFPAIRTRGVVRRAAPRSLNSSQISLEFSLELLSLSDGCSMTAACSRKQSMSQFTGRSARRSKQPPRRQFLDLREASMQFHCSAWATPPLSSPTTARVGF